MAKETTRSADAIPISVVQGALSGALGFAPPTPSSEPPREAALQPAKRVEIRDSFALAQDAVKLSRQYVDDTFPRSISSISKQVGDMSKENDLKTKIIWKRACNNLSSRNANATMYEEPAL